MAESKLKIDTRRSAILERLRMDGTLSVSQLCKDLGVTPVTMRNDLAALERDGYLIRVRGGAVPSQRLQGSFSTEAHDEHFLQKQALGVQVAELISDGQTLFLNSGTTTHHIARALHSKKYLNIVTNSLAVAMELGDNPTFHVLLLGGEVSARYGFTSGGDTQDQLCKYTADWAILSVDGISALGGLTTYHPEEAIIDRLMIANAKQILVAATGHKIGRAGFSRICECNARLHLVTDGAAGKAALEELQTQGVKIHTV